ncbi:MAG: hypothetical protein ACOYBE_09220 [Blautia sp.]
MDVKESIDKVVSKAKDDKEYKEKLHKEPVKALEELLGVDLPDEQVKAVLDGVKSKIHLDKAGDIVEEVEEKVKDVVGGLFHKKEQE